MSLINIANLYAQFAAQFPGIVIDEGKELLRFSNERFAEELDNYLLNSQVVDYFALSSKASSTFMEFAKKDLTVYPLIRGQVVGRVVV